MCQQQRPTARQSTPQNKYLEFPTKFPCICTLVVCLLLLFYSANILTPFSFTMSGCLQRNSVSVNVHLFRAVAVNVHLFSAVGVNVHLFSAVGVNVHLFSALGVNMLLFSAVGVILCIIKVLGAR